MLLLWILLLTVLFKESPASKQFVIKHIDSCPAEGYYFRRELILNSATPTICYLCFCQYDGTATCWQRENKKCDAQSYHHHNVGKRDGRAKRGIGLGDIFFRDAARDIFNKQLPEECKPYESSFSDGCPPVDWCIGCTVCDCDANGRWDCHVLSYCPNKPTKKPTPKPRRRQLRRKVVRKSAKRTIKPSPKKMPKFKSQPKLKPNKNQPKPIIGYKSSNVIRPKRQPIKNLKPGNNKNIIQRRNQGPRKIVKKYVVKKPVTQRVDTTKQILLPSSPELAQAAVRQIMAAVQKMMRNDLKKGNSSKILKVVDRKRPANMNNNKKNQTQKIKQSKSYSKTTNSQKNKARNKRGVNLDKVNSTRVNTAVSSSKEFLYEDKEVNNKSTFTIVLLQNTLTEPDSFKFSNNITTFIDLVDSDTNYVIPNATTPMTTVLKATTAMTPANRSTEDILSDDYNLTTTRNILNNTILSNMTNLIANVSNVIKDKQYKMIYRIERVPSSVNDLKFKKWAQVKLLNDKTKHFKVELFKSKNFINEFNDISPKVPKALSDTTEKIYVKHQVKKVGASKRYNVKKLVNTSKIAKKEQNYTTKTHLYNVNNKITQLQSFVKNILNGFSKNTTSRRNRKLKHFSVLRFIRKLFRKIFISRQEKLSNKEKTFIVTDHIVATLCKQFGPCRISRQEKKLLKIKLKHLRYEIAKVFTTMNIIKGLLHLIKLPSENAVDFKKAKSSFSDDILKLNCILKGMYQERLSETISKQIDYIKNNTQTFVQSIGKIATLLNEMIIILTKPKTKDIYFRRTNSVATQSNQGEAITYIKSLLLKYDIIHNSFIKRIYEIISSFDSKSNKEKQADFDMRKDLGYNHSINNFSTNIITNLRKVTKLAQKLNSKRQKRQVTGDDDAIEYLLMLMEHFLKQNYPLNAAPVNDGIDLLLESIKHSPDIKSIRKKVLESPKSRAIEKVTSLKIVQKSNAVKASVNGNSKNEPTITLEDITVPQELEKGRDYEDKYFLIKKSINRNTKSAKDRNHIESYRINSNVDYTINTETDMTKANDKLKSHQATFDRIVDRYSDTDNKSRYEVYNADLDEDNEVNDTSTSEPSTESNMVVVTIALDANVKNEQDRSTSELTKLEWVDKDAKEYKSWIHHTSTTTSTAKSRTMQRVTGDNISAISNEVKREGNKSSKSIEDVMLKKQMDLLSSLDYGTEKTNTEENETSKEVGTEEKDSVDTFPAYFA